MRTPVAKLYVGKLDGNRRGGYATRAGERRGGCPGTRLVDQNEFPTGAPRDRGASY